MVADSACNVLGPSDAELLTATGRGEGAALGVLVDRYVDLVYGVAVRRTCSTHLAEDVTQAVFLVLRTRAASVRDASLPGWLHQTTRHVAASACRAERRRSRRERIAARPEADMDTAKEEPIPLALMLDEALSSLGTKDRTVIIDRYLQGRDLASVAASLGASPGAVQKRIERSLAKLRSYFLRHQREIDATSIAEIGSAVAAAPLFMAATVKAAVIRPGATSAASVILSKGILFMHTLKIATASFVSVVMLGGVMVICIEATNVSNAGTMTTTPAVKSKIDSPTMDPTIADSNGPFAKQSPFSDIKWAGESAQILIDGKWYTWVSIDGRLLADLIKDAREMDDRLWQKRIDEDLVELLERTGHPAGSTVKLVVNPIDNAGQAQTLEKVPMTEENRRSVHKHRVERGET